MEKELKFIDLTHSLTENVSTWDGSCGFELSLAVDYKDCKPPELFRIQKISCSAGIGTHMDAPCHVIPGGRTIDQLPLQELITDCIVIDVSDVANENYKILPEVVTDFESSHGLIPKNSVVIFYTGWDKRWNNPEEYRNSYKFPFLDIATAELLIERGIFGLGTDTLSADTGEVGFPVHRAILGANKYLIENVANAKMLPPTGAKILVLPLKIKDATEAPIRLIAILEG
jgi:kynurenine formamidase